MLVQVNEPYFLESSDNLLRRLTLFSRRGGFQKLAKINKGYLE